MKQNKYNIGYLDEEEQWQLHAHHALKDDLFEPVIIELPISLDEIWAFIQDNSLDAIIIDFKLYESGLVSYTGNDVVSEITSHNQHFPMFIMTSYREDAIDNCSNVLIINNKNIFDLEHDEDLLVFKKMLKVSIENFNKNIEYANDTIINLSSKKTLSAEEEEMLFKAERFLYETNKDSGIKENMLSKVYSAKLVEMCNKADEIITALINNK